MKKYNNPDHKILVREPGTCTSVYNGCDVRWHLTSGEISFNERELALLELLSLASHFAAARDLEEVTRLVTTLFPTDEEVVATIIKGLERCANKPLGGFQPVSCPWLDALEAIPNSTDSDIKTHNT